MPASLAKALNLEDPSSKTLNWRGNQRPNIFSGNTIAHFGNHCLSDFCERFLGTPENNSKAAFLSTIKILTKSKIFSLNQGMGVSGPSSDKLVNIRFHSAVLKVRSLGNNRGPYRVDIGGSDPKSLIFDRVIFALPCVSPSDFRGVL